LEGFFREIYGEVEKLEISVSYLSVGSKKGTRFTKCSWTDLLDNVEDSKPIPSKVTFSYIENPSATGKIKVETGQPDFSIEDQGTVYEYWRLNSIRIYNIQTPLSNSLCEI